MWDWDAIAEELPGAPVEHQRMCVGTVRRVWFSHQGLMAELCVHRAGLVNFHFFLVIDANFDTDVFTLSANSLSVTCVAAHDKDGSPH
jgi:hypothetical protein